MAAPGWRQPVVEVLEWKWRYQDVIFWIPELPLLAYGASGTRSGSIRLFHSSPGVLPCPSNLRRRYLLDSAASHGNVHRSKYRVGNKLDIRKEMTYRPKYGADAPKLSCKRAVGKRVVIMAMYVV